MFNDNGIGMSLQPDSRVACIHNHSGLSNQAIDSGIINHMLVTQGSNPNVNWLNCLEFRVE